MPSQAEILDYLAKSGDDAFGWNMPCHEFDGGWYTYSIEKDQTTFVIHQAYGSAKALKEMAVEFATRMGCRRILYVANTRGEASARMFGGKILGTLIEVPLWAAQSAE